jgi:hypothetical protein
MKRMKILTNSTRVADMSFEEFYENVLSDWEQKAQRLQARRWRKLKHQLL